LSTGNILDTNTMTGDSSSAEQVRKAARKEMDD
jgi:hypothetical protein